jgi:hypothetical protein
MISDSQNNNGFKLDVSADMRALNMGFENGDTTPSSLINPHNDIPSVDSMSYQVAPTLELPESLLFETTPEKIQPSSQIQQASLQGIDFAVEVRPEEAMEMATEVDKNLNLVKKDLESLAGQMRNPDNRMNSRDNYEEKVTIPATNLIFEARKNRMTQFPEWV